MCQRCCRTPPAHHFDAMQPISPSIAARRLDALQACAENPRGLRAGAYPGTLPVLEAAGLVARRSSGPLGRNWHWVLTDAGRATLAANGYTPDPDLAPRFRDTFSQ